MFLGIITYLDTVKGFKIDYSAFYDIDTITIAFLDETRYHDYRQQNRAVRKKCYQHLKRPSQRI